MDRYNHLHHTPQTAYSHVRNTNNMRFQLPNTPLGSTGKPYRVAVRIIREKKGHDEDVQVEEGGNAALNSVGTSASETLINQVPPNFCSIWHPQSADERVQLGEMVGAAMMQGCGVYVLCVSAVI
eukprot:GDKK01017067.1.p1 GENE.GDKK01017067.1~~GDKK01017067.1.p1  ORF type:complete len:125 (+),score=9.54 GDKK01017067.1:117-491(+)